MTPTPQRKRTVLELIGISLCGIGICLALSLILVSYSEERVTKDKQQLMAKMDEMKVALGAAKIPEEQIPGLLRVYRATLVHDFTHEHFIILSFLVLMSLLVASVGLTLLVWAKLHAERMRVNTQIAS